MLNKKKSQRNHFLEQSAPQVNCYFTWHRFSMNHKISAPNWKSHIFISVLRFITLHVLSYCFFLSFYFRLLLLLHKNVIVFVVTAHQCHQCKCVGQIITKKEKYKVLSRNSFCIDFDWFDAVAFATAQHPRNKSLSLSFVSNCYYCYCSLPSSLCEWCMYLFMWHSSPNEMKHSAYKRKTTTTKTKNMKEIQQ